MTPQERELVAALFDRLAALETNPRDPEAERLVTQGLARAPHALYPLIQTVLLQEEALKRANARIEELEGNTAEPRNGSFLDNMRGTLFGHGTAGGRDDARGSVPSVRPSGVWNTGQPNSGVAPPQPQPTQTMPGQVASGAGSFLGTAAAAAVGMIGGSLLFNGIRGLMGGGHPAALGSYEPTGAARSPWGNEASGDDLARSAGLDDVGTRDLGGSRFAGNDSAQTADVLDHGADDFDADDIRDGDIADSGFGDAGSSDA